MTFLFTLFGLLTDTAHAVTLETAGAENSGVSQMWGIICDTLPFCSEGIGGVDFFTQRVITLVFSLIGGVAVMLVIYAGIRLTTSQGDPEGLSNAKKIIMQTLVGLALALMATAAVSFVAYTLTRITS